MRDYRCFRDEQTAVLAPLTLLVGDNSSGKTSFLALMRAMWDVAHSHRSWDFFKEEPYDLGSFDEIAHHRGARGGRAESFEAELKEASGLSIRVTFGSDGVAPVPIRRRCSLDDTWIEEGPIEKEKCPIQYGTAGKAWKTSVDLHGAFANRGAFGGALEVFFAEMVFEWLFEEQDHRNGSSELPTLSQEDKRAFDNIIKRLPRYRETPHRRPFASAPVRSKPRRTYDPARVISDPEGDHVPMYLAQKYVQDKQRWEALKEGLEAFGKQAGLFDEIFIKRLGRKGSGPFQVQVRKFGGKLKGPQRNLIDVGYGVSQALPIITELLHPDAPKMFLLQQPEVHLHPSAQAAMGSVFCQEAGLGRQLIIETHSDHLMDRVRMDVRDRKTELRAKDVSILYFERKQLSVRIHSIKLDDMGNIHDAPDDYRRFFMEETRRSLGL